MATFATIRCEERANIVRAWQGRLDLSTNVVWIRRLIPDVEKWIGRGARPVKFHLTRVLIGHGCFAYYLHRIGSLRGPSCWYFPYGDDTVERTVFTSPRWADESREVGAFIFSRDLRPEDTLDLPCGPVGVRTQGGDDGDGGKGEEDIPRLYRNCHGLERVG